MARLSLLFRTDCHVADRSPVSWKGDYPAEVWSNLDQIGELARKHDVQAVLDGGDYFHIKAASRNSHSLVVRSLSVHRAYPCRILCVEGNHDIKHNNLSSVDKQPLGVLYESGVFEHLRDVTLEHEGLKVRVVGFPYSPFRTLEDLQSVRKQGDEFLVAVVHALAGKDPPSHVSEFFGEPVFRYENLIVDGGPDVFCFGHWHQDQGVEEIDGRYFLNQGAVSRGAISKENLTREPKVALIEFLDGSINVTTIPLQVAPSSEVFNLELKARQDRETREIERYVARLKTDLGTTTESTIQDVINTLDFVGEIRELAFHYLEQALGDS